jgi:hypothetical protein
VEWLKSARFKWMLTEYRQPTYVMAFGEPVWKKTVQVATAVKKQWQATECVWKNYWPRVEKARVPALHASTL